MPAWTEEQLSAIEARNHSILVSAAAGSGKTAVLVERIVRLLLDGARLNRMIICTFTKAAASEMRQRLKMRLTDEIQLYPAIMEQALEDLESASINTIHAICQGLLREEFQAAGIDPGFQVCDEATAGLMKQAAFKKAANELLEEQDEDATFFLRCYGEEEGFSFLSQAYAFLMSMPDPFAWLYERVRELREVPYYENGWYRLMIDEVQHKLEGFWNQIHEMEDYFNLPFAFEKSKAVLQADKAILVDLLDICQRYPENLPEALATISWKQNRGPTAKAMEEEKTWFDGYKAMRNQFKKQIGDCGNLFPKNRDNWGEDIQNVGRQLQGLANLLSRFHQRFFEEKQRKNVIDFSDMEQMALLVLDIPAIREKQQNQVDHIFVDECQDVSQTQDAIIQRLHGENSCLFMVGDVKQSIYRFRLADPTLFLHRMETWSDDIHAKERRIFLSKNFRSTATVLEATNEVFRRTMHRDVTELDYKPEYELVPGRQTESNPPVEVVLIRKEEDGEVVSTKMEDKIEYYARAVAERIEALRKETFMDNGVERHYEYRDMVILSPIVSSKGEQLKAAFEECGVPLYYDGGANFFDKPEIRHMTCLLQVIDNWRQDYPLLGALGNVPFAFTDEELAMVRVEQPQGTFFEAVQAAAKQDSPIGRRCQAALTQLENWHFEADMMGVEDFLWKLVEETGMAATIGTLPDGENRQLTLNMLCQQAADFEARGGLTLHDFMTYIGDMEEGNEAAAPTLLSEEDNVVYLMTMHKSKGLEFPVVFLLNMDGKLLHTNKASLTTNRRIGISLPVMDPDKRLRYHTILETACTLRNQMEERAEKARLLYVAMTRAREKLIMVTASDNEQIWAMKPGPQRIATAGNMGDWIMATACDLLRAESPSKSFPQFSTSFQQAANHWFIRVWEAKENETVENIEVFHSLEEKILDTLKATGHPEQYNHWQGLYEPPERLPAKTSVTSLVQAQVTVDRLHENEEEETQETKSKERENTTPLRMSPLEEKPAFLQEKTDGTTGAQLGTLTHRVLSLLEVGKMEQPLNHWLEGQVQHLVAEGILTSQEGKLLPRRGILRYLESDLCHRMAKAAKLRREWSFVQVLQEGVVMQGVIDCAFRESDGWVIVDFKSDHIADEGAFMTRYGKQIQLYATAVEKITGEAVKEGWLFSLSQGKAMAVDL